MTTEQQTKRSRGRPPGTTGTPAGTLHISTSAVCATLMTGPEEQAAATGNTVLKVPTKQPGHNGKANAARVYLPIDWIGKPVLCMQINQATAHQLQADSHEAEAAALRQQAAELQQNNDEDYTE